MPVDQPWNVYREQLSSLYQGYALWEPAPVKSLYDKVSIGDVGYWDNPKNQRFGASKPVNYKPMRRDDFTNIHESLFTKGDYYSPHVSRQSNTDNLFAHAPRDDEGFTYECQGPGALLSLPRDGHREDVVRTKAFEDYVRDNVVSWFNWSKNQRLPVDSMEDLILVTGFTLVESWAAVAFIGRSRMAKLSLIVAQRSEGNDRSFECNNIQGDVTQHCSFFDPRNTSSMPNQCVFIRGFRAKRVFFRTRPIRAAAGPLPDDPDNRRGDEIQATRVSDTQRHHDTLIGIFNSIRDMRRFFRTKRVRAAAEPPADNPDNRREEIQVTRVPDIPKYRDPLNAVLDYIAEKCPEGTIAITHDDDLQLVKNVETLTSDAVEHYLRRNEIPVLVENGAAILRNQHGKKKHGNAPPVRDHQKKISVATGESAQPKEEQTLATSLSSSRPNKAMISSIKDQRSGYGPYNDVKRTAARTPTPVSPPLPTHKSDKMPAPKPPKRAVLSPSSPHNDGTPVSSPSQRSGGMTASPPAQLNVEKSESRPSGHNIGRRAHSSFRVAPVTRSISTQPLSPSGLAVPSSPSTTRTMLAPESPPNTKFQVRPRKRHHSTPGTNKVHVKEDIGLQQFPSTLRTVLSDNLRFRILVVGKGSSGKSSLINSVFKVDMSTALGKVTRLKTSDINAGYTFSENRHLIVHEYSSFGPGAVQNMSTVRKFIIDRTHVSRSTSERLHAIWICVPTSDVVDKNLGDEVDEILGLNGVVPVVVVATKFDVLVSKTLFDIAEGDIRFYDQARAIAHKRYDQSCRSLFHRNTRDVSVETISTKPRFGDLILKLITTTYKLVTGDPRNALSETQVANSQVAPVPLVCSIAQRASHDLIIQASIEVGRSRYWRTLESSPDFTDQIFEEYVDVIHTDIIGVWSLRDEDGYLLSRKFKTEMYDLVKDLTPYYGPPPLSSKPSGMMERQASTSGVGWASTLYLDSSENVRCMMGYIVDLTVILYGLFTSGRDVSASRVDDVMTRHIESGLRKRIHEGISRFVAMPREVSINRRNDPVMEKIIDLIIISCVPQPRT